MTNSKMKTGVLLVNLGTPEAPTKQAVKAYLKEFLSDPRVIEVNRLIWWFALRVILFIRPKKVAPKYAQIWTEQGSPLLGISRQQAAALSKSLKGEMSVALGMSYGKPSINDAIDGLISAGAQRIVTLPLYPQYSGTTTASVFAAVTKHLSTKRDIPALEFIRSYQDHPLYIKALKNSVEEYWQQNGQADVLLLSFHGIPLRYVKNGDPYAAQCCITAEELGKALGLGAEQWTMSFQSRVGREPWLEPYTDQTVEGLGKQGKTIDVICPGFSADCLETLEEIADENREIYEAAGGKQYRYIPCLNDRPDHLELLTELVRSNAN